MTYITLKPFTNSPYILFGNLESSEIDKKYTQIPKFSHKETEQNKRFEKSGSDTMQHQFNKNLIKDHRLKKGNSDSKKQNQIFRCECQNALITWDKED